MSATDIHLLFAYLMAAATVWLAATIFDGLWRNRKKRR